MDNNPLTSTESNHLMSKHDDERSWLCPCQTETDRRHTKSSTALVCISKRNSRPGFEPGSLRSGVGRDTFLPRMPILQFILRLQIWATKRPLRVTTFIHLQVYATNAPWDSSHTPMAGHHSTQPSSIRRTHLNRRLAIHLLLFIMRSKISYVPRAVFV